MASSGTTIAGSNDTNPDERAPGASGHAKGCCLCSSGEPVRVVLFAQHGSMQGWLTAKPAPHGVPVDVSADALGLLTVAEVAQLLRLSTATVWRRIHAGEIESVKVGRSRRVPPKSVAVFISSLAGR